MANLITSEYFDFLDSFFYDAMKKILLVVLPAVYQISYLTLEPNCGSVQINILNNTHLEFLSRLAATQAIHNKP